MGRGNRTMDTLIFLFGIRTHFDWSFARLIAPVITTSYITLSFNKIQNGDILVLDFRVVLENSR